MLPIHKADALQLDQAKSRSIKVNQGQSRSIKVNQGQSRSIKVNQGQSRSIKVNQGQSRSIKRDQAKNCHPASPSREHGTRTKALCILLHSTSGFDRTCWDTFHFFKL